MERELTLGIKSANLSIYSTLARVPEIQLLFIGPLACTRHGILEAVLNLQERMSFLCVNATDVIIGSYLNKITEAAEQIHAETSAKGLILITCCQNSLLGTDFDGITHDLSQKLQIPVRHLEINRLYLYAKRPKPAMRIPQTEFIYEFLLPMPRAAEPTVTLIGNPVGIDKKSELFDFLHAAGIRKIFHIADCQTFQEYMAMAQSHLNIALNEESIRIATALEQRLEIPFLALDAVYSPDELNKQYLAIGDFFNTKFDISQDIELLKNRANDISQKLSGTSIVIDGSITEHPLALAKWLLEMGFHVKAINLTDFSTKEPTIASWFAQHHPQTEIRHNRYRPSPTLLSSEQLRSRQTNPLPTVGLHTCHRALDKIEQILSKEEHA